MKIDRSTEPYRYWDRNGDEIHDGDTIVFEDGGRKYKVYLTEQGMLGTDATNPLWIESGRADPCQYGIYPFSPGDEPLLVGDD